MKRLHILVTAALCVAALSGCSSPGDSGGGGGGGSTIDATPYLTRYTENVVEADYTSFATSSSALATAVSNLAIGNATTVTDARNAWKATRQAWERSESWLFGPVDTNGVDPGVDTWPLDITFIAANIDGGSAYPVTQDDRKGFHAIEWALWDLGLGPNQTATDIANALDANTITNLGTIAINLAGLAAGLETDWTDDGAYGDDFIASGNGGNHVSQSAAMQEAINGMIGIADEVGSGKIGGPFGDGNLDNVESQFSFNSITDFHNNILGIQIAYLGEYTASPSQQANSISALVASKNATLDSNIQNLIAAALTAIDAMDVTLFHTTPDDPGTNAQDAIDALDDLRSALEGDLLSFIQDLDFKY